MDTGTGSRSDAHGERAMALRRRPTTGPARTHAGAAAKRSNDYKPENGPALGEVGADRGHGCVGVRSRGQRALLRRAGRARRSRQ
jgi:hypothetical protein